MNGSELIGDEFFLVSRQAVPATLTRLSLTDGAATQVTTVPSGIEGWAATAVNDGADLYMACTPRPILTTTTSRRAP